MMEEAFKDSGKIIKCKEKVYSNGRMEENIKVIMIMIRKVDSEYSPGQMEGNMKETGFKVNKMVLENIHQLLEKLEMEFGRMDKE
jgi:hypothetical protein